MGWGSCPLGRPRPSAPAAAVARATGRVAAPGLGTRTRGAPTLPATPATPAAAAPPALGGLVVVAPGVTVAALVPVTALRALATLVPATAPRAVGGAGAAPGIAAAR